MLFKGFDVQLVGSQLEHVIVMSTVIRLCFSNADIPALFELRVYSDIQLESTENGFIATPSPLDKFASSAFCAAKVIGLSVIEAKILPQGTFQIDLENGSKLSILGTNQKFENSWVLLRTSDESRELYCSDAGEVDVLLIGTNERI